MANIFLTDEAYAKFKALKKEGQSFSDYILELPQEIDWKRFVGAWKDVDTEKIKAHIKKDRR